MLSHLSPICAPPAVATRAKDEEDVDSDEDVGDDDTDLSP